MRPLDFLGRIKVKLGIVIVLAVVTAFVVNEVGINAGLPRDARIAVAAVLALIMVQLLAMGMTRPLREMAAAAQTIAKGRYGLRVSATSRDEVGELARAFNAMAADLGEVDRQRRELVANVSHELRTPIAGLQAVLENVVDGVSPPDLDTLGTALAQTQRLGRLTAQLLDLSRLDSGARLIEPEVLDLASLCRQAASEAALGRDDVTVVSMVSETSLSADPALLAQVLANLLDNAVRHSPPGGTVRLESRLTGPSLEVSVVDQGPGIPSGERTRVFERFSRLDAGRAAGTGGAGLGLAIAKEIVELHDGSIYVTDAPTHTRAAGAPGCRLVVALPATIPGTVLPPHPADDTETAPSPAETGAPPPSRLPATGEPRTPPEPDTALGTPGPEAGTAEPPTPVSVPAPDTTTGVTMKEPADGPAAGTMAGPVAAPAPAPVTDTLPAPVTGQGDQIAADPQRNETPRDTPASTAPTGGQPPGSHAAGSQPAATQPAATQPAGTQPAGIQAAGIQAAGIQAAGIQAAGAQAVGSQPAGAQAAGTQAAGSQPAEGQAAATQAAATQAAATQAAGTQAAGTQAAGSQAAGTQPAGSQAAGTHPSGTHPSGTHPSGTHPSGSHQVAGHQAGAAPALYPGAHHSPPPVYVPPPLLPRPELPEVPRWLLPAAAAAGLVAAVALPHISTGLGLVLTAVALGAAVFPATLPVRRGRLTPWTVSFGVLAYALVSVALFRDADWLVAPALLLAFAIAALALSGAGKGWLGLLRGGASVALSTLLVPWFLSGPLKRLRKHRRVLPVLAGTGITVVFLTVFGLLFGSADAVFQSYMSRLLQAPGWLDNMPFRVFLFAVFAVLAAAGALVALRPVADPPTPDLRVKLDRGVWVIPLVALNLLFASFVAIQITVLFGGSRRVLSTAGLTYAEYARSGFFELVTVSIFVLGIVAAIAALLRPARRPDRWLPAVLLGLLCAFTLVILASALHRLDLYTDAYGLSRLRAAVQVTIWWLAAVFVLVLTAGAIRLRGPGVPWFFRSLVLLTGLTVFTFAVWNPEARVAETQMAVRGIDRLDHEYLGDLGPEAVPALDRLPEPSRSCVLRDVVSANDLDTPDPWNGWNLALARARDILRQHPVLRQPDCPALSRSLAPLD
ncbi:DUF4153 domain-containing protein [Sphaerisporangium sp. B11E5]|uniref:DUF4153 domain-containing protein n=1 Tax=Sphaerisporangium sp. B11E5 TaxID=3153563 RepID=UPI00325E253E